MNEWLILYLVGCIAAFVLLTFNAVFFWLLAWMTKGNILARNLKKIQPQNESSLGARAATIIGTVLLEVALSWLSVLVGSWQLIRVVFESIREILTSVPERVKSLRFPLRNNPQLSPESVWAYVIGLGAAAGQPLTQTSEIWEALQEVTENCPRFDRRRALLQLQELHVVDRQILSAVLQELEVE